MNVAPEFAQIPTEVLRQLKAKSYPLPWIDTYSIGRISVDQRCFAPELEFHLREQGGDELVGQTILIAQLQDDILTSGQGEGRMQRIFSRGLPLDHVEGLLLDDQNHVGLILRLLNLGKSDACSTG